MSNSTLSLPSRTPGKLLTNHSKLALPLSCWPQLLGKADKSPKQLGNFKFYLLLSSFCLKKGVSPVSDALEPFLTQLISLFQSLKPPLGLKTPLSASKRYVDSVFVAFSFLMPLKHFPTFSHVCMHASLPF